MNYIARGILIGGSLGVIAGLLGVFTAGRGMVLGMIAGFLAGWTMERKRAKKRDRDGGS